MSKLTTPRPEGEYFEIGPDWTKVWTAAEAERELAKFKFDGPGWYREGADHMLVVPLVPMECSPTGHWNLWKHRGWPPDQQFRFMVFNRDPRASVNALANAPTREGE